MDSIAGYLKYWGKTAAPDLPDPACHLLPYHCLDVGAVGRHLLRSHPPLNIRLASLTGMSPDDFHRWAVYLLILHDIGKFAVTFQTLRPDLLNILQLRRTDKKSERHDTLGFLLWKKTIRPLMQEWGMLPASRPRRTAPSEIESIDVWMAATTGHHGRPPKGGHLLLQDAYEAPDLQAAMDFVRDLTELLLPECPGFPRLQPEAVRPASWWLAGFAVLCDWIGSNSEYFPYRDEPMALGTYWKIAQLQAERAVAETGLLPKAVAPSLRLNQLLGTTSSVIPTPLQALAADGETGTGPELLILEDVTGAGKTEAALLLAQRLMAKGLAHGIYMGLPTMATANAMYERLGRRGFRQLYAPDSRPTLVLAHGAAHLSDDFRRSIVSARLHPDGDYDGQPGAAAHCTQWLADNRKKALLADMGIGTIDQALLAVLPSRHQSLRLLGLLGKVLIVDEVHACDAYMHRLMCRLLQAHAAAGGSAILLSATLPQQQRQELADAYTKGIGAARQLLTANAYPLLTRLNERGATESAVPTRNAVRREVRIECFDNPADVESAIAHAVAAGQCVCWIRNSVADAREAYTLLHERHPEWRIDLFHARFALADRLDIEQRVLRAFGPDSLHNDRCGRLLVATQVVEQSLDLDFDQLITDLAPIDLIIQRAGRLRRHRRDALGNPIDGVDQRGPAALWLHTPTWADEPEDDWFAAPFRRASAVYPDHGQLWLGLKLLRECGSFRMPEDARRLIEGVYGSDVEIPAGLQCRTWNAQGDAKAHQSIAMLNELKIELGYDDCVTNRWWDDTQTPTRLGEATTTVWLARWEHSELKAWRIDLAFPWQQSSLSLRSELIGEPVPTDEIPQAAIDACVETLPAQGKWGALLPLTDAGDGTWQAQTRDGHGEPTRFRYSPSGGLITEKELKTMEENRL